MKRKFLIVSGMVCLFICMLFVTACGGHEHTYSEEWSSDETYHWHAATCEHTGEVSDKAEHTFSNGVCTVCHYVLADTTGLEFTLSGDGTSYSVSGIGKAAGANISIPSSYNGLPVTAVEDYAFSGCDLLTSVTVPASVKSVGVYAFDGCSSLERISLESVTST